MTMEWDSLSTQGVTSQQISGFGLIRTPLQTWTIYSSGSNYVYERDNGVTTTVPKTSGADLAVMAAMSGSAGAAIIQFKQGQFFFQNPVQIPTGGNGAFPTWVIKGVPEHSRSKGTIITAQSGFPYIVSSLNYLFDCHADNATHSGQTAQLEIADMFLCNLSALSGAVGGIRMESDINQNQFFKVHGITTQYLHHGLYMAGPVWHANLTNLQFRDDSSIFSGDCDLKVEPGTSHGDIVKFLYASDIHCDHHGAMNNAYFFTTGYSRFYNLKVDGAVPMKFNTAPLEFQNCNTNDVIGLTLLDLNTEGDNTQSAILFDSTGSGCYANKIYAAQVGLYGVSGKNMVAFHSGAHRNYVELGYFGGNISFDASGAGTQNIIHVVPGANVSGVVDLKISGFNNTTNTIKIIDDRLGATVAGSATMVSGATALSVSNACFDVISTVQVQPTTNTSGFTWWVSGKLSGAFSVFASPSAFSGGFSFDYTASIYP